MIRGVDNLTCEERLKELKLFNLEKAEERSESSHPVCNGLA